jgi:hypothetical protein
MRLTVVVRRGASRSPASAAQAPVRAEDSRQAAKLWVTKFSCGCRAKARPTVI